MADQKKKLCFVLMPFKEDLIEVYSKAIKPACTKAGFDALRVDELEGPLNINRKVIEYIFNSDAVVADLTEWNPNVFYELGVAHAIDNKTVMIIQKKNDIPFDVKTYRCIQYEQNEAGLKKLQEGIIKSLLSINDWRTQPSNPVQEFKPHDAFIPKSILEEVQGRLQKTEELLAKFPSIVEHESLKKELEQKISDNRALQQELQLLQTKQFIKVVSSDESYVKLMPSRNNPNPSPALLVIDDDIAMQWAMNKQDILIIGSLTLSAIPYSGLEPDRKKLSNRTLQGAEWVTPDMFFTPMFFYVAQKNAFPGCIEVEGIRNMYFQSESITPIIPLQSWLLQYFSLEDLCKRIAFEKTIDGILVSLKLTLRGPDGNGKDFIIKKEYRNADNKLYAIRQLPVVEIWPNFKAEGWKAYYTYYSHGNRARTFYAAPVAIGAKFETQSRMSPEWGLNTIAPNTFTSLGATLKLESYKDNLIDCETPNEGPRLEQIIKLDRFPEAFACFFDLPDTNLKKFETIPVGLILLLQPDPPVRQTEDWKIGIDFNPIVTNVRYSVGEIEPRAMEFNDHFVSVTDPPNSDRTDAIIYRFVAGKNATAPFPSIYHDFRIADPTDTTLRPVLDGHIFFKNKSAIFNALSDEMYTNLKWGNLPDDRKRVRAFLSQLCLQCAVEAVSRGAKYVSWRYSFPTLFSANESLSFDQVWRQIIEECNNLTSISIPSESYYKETLKPVIAKPAIIAFSQFFADRHDIQTVAAFGNRSVCVNIQTDVSDIAIWYDQKLQWQAPIPFAKRGILLNLFYQNPSFFKYFEKENEIALLQELTNTKKEIRFYSHLDVLLKERGEKWLEHLHLFAGEPPMLGFTQLLALSLSGLMFYMGQLLGALRQNKKLKSSVEVPNVFIGGDGARLFDWLAGGSRYRDTSPISGLFKAMLIAGSNFKTKELHFKICTSLEPQSEVAYGLVSDKTILRRINQFDTLGVIAGERFVEDDTEREWHEKLSIERFHSGLGSPANLEQFQKFLETFKSFTKSPIASGLIKPIHEDEVALHSCKQYLAQQLVSAKVSEAEDVRIEPLFFVVLKHFLDIKINQWANTQEPV